MLHSEAKLWSGREGIGIQPIPASPSFHIVEEYMKP
jgi:hypothetical protein